MIRSLVASLLTGVLVAAAGCAVPTTGAKPGDARVCADARAPDCPPPPRRFSAGDRGR